MVLHIRIYGCEFVTIYGWILKESWGWFKFVDEVIQMKIEKYEIEVCCLAEKYVI